MTVLIVAILLGLAIFFKFRDQIKKKTSGRSIDPRIWTVLIIIVGLGISNFLIASLSPWLWGIINFNSITLTAFNVGIGSMSFLRTVKAKDDKGNPTKEVDPTASKWASIITIALVIGFGSTVYEKWQKGNGIGGGSGHYAVRELKPGEWSKPPVVNPIGNVTMSLLVTGVTEEDKKECYIRVDNEKIVPLKHDFKNEPRTYESFEFKCKNKGVLIVDVTRN